MTAGGRRRLATPLLLAAAAVWGGCSVEKHYALLTVFFDGVPDPNAPVGRGLAGTGAVILSFHPDFRDRNCRECHGGTSRFSFTASGFSDLDGSVCLKCHPGVTTEFDRMHGPVAALACLWCHQPHESIYDNLLKAESPGMCLSCHEFHLDDAPPIPEHQDLERDCMDCHGAHGGANQYFLRPPEPEPIDEEAGSSATASETGPTEAREE